MVPGRNAVADSVGLHQLVGAVAGAIVDAQGLVEQRFIEQVSRYFDAEGNPLCLAVKMPRPGGADGDSMQIGVPLLSLTEASMLGIADLKIELDVELGSVIDNPATLDHEPDAPPAPASAPMAAAAPAIAPPLFRTGGAPIDVPQAAAAPVAAQDTAAADPAAAPQAARAPAPPAPPEKMLTLSVGTATANGPKARLTINVAARPPSEAMQRLMTQLNKLV